MTRSKQITWWTFYSYRLKCLRNTEFEVTIPGDIPDTGADDNEIRFRSLSEILQDALHVRGEDACQEVETQ